VGRFILRRLLQAVPTVFGIMVLTFALTRLAPSDPLDYLVGGVQDFTPEQREALRETLGLNQPLHIQFLDWMSHAVRLDFGKSFFYQRPAAQLIAERIPNSLQLAIPALFLSLGIGVPLGLLAALNRGRATDHVIRFFSVLGHAIPVFWFGLLFVLILGVQLHWFPIGSMYTLGHESDLLDRMWHLVGPVIATALAGIANYPRFLRTEVLEILGQDYVRTARSKGLRERVVVLRHITKNALLPVVTLLGGILAIFVSGSVVIEQVFTWPGLGRLLFEAANQKDYPVVQAAVLAASGLLVLSFILRDIAYAWVDPRIRLR
jgi:peptide/nickel transport system permease protein